MAITRPTLLFVSCIAVFTLVGCNAEPNADLEAPVVTEPGAAPVEPTVPDDEAVTMRYSCDGGWNVAVKGDVVEVTADDGRVIQLQRIDDRSPPLFAGEALEFSVEDGGAVLGQDEGGPIACRAD